MGTIKLKSVKTTIKEPWGGDQGDGREKCITEGSL